MSGDAERLPCDDPGFSDLIREVRPGLVAAAMRYTGSRDEAEDLVQTVLLRVVTKRPGGGVTAPYLFRAVANAGRNYRRDRELHRVLQTRLRIEQQTQPNPLAPDYLLAWRDASELLDRLLDTLTPGQERAVTAVLLLGKSYGRAAEELGVSPNTVREQVRRARKRFRRYLEGEADP